MTASQVDWAALLAETWAFYSYEGPRRKRNGDFIELGMGHQASVCTDANNGEEHKCLGDFRGNTEHEACARAEVAAFAKRALSILLLAHAYDDTPGSLDDIHAKEKAARLTVQLIGEIDALESETTPS
jgi:hypothetical protein